MSYYIKREEINTAEKIMIAKADEWNSQLSTLKETLSALVNTEAITGKTADNMRDYISEGPIEIINAMIACLELFRTQMMRCANGYSNVDSDESAKVRTGRLKNVSEYLTLRNEYFYNTRESITSKLNEVSDIFTSKALPNTIYDDFEALKKKLSDLEQLVTDYETDHANDMDGVQDLLSSLDKVLNAELNRTSVQMSSYAKGVIPTSESMLELSKALLFTTVNTESNNQIRQNNPEKDLAVIIDDSDDNNKNDCQLSDDYDAIIYNGERYNIIQPDYSGKTQNITSSTWQVVAVIEEHNLSFDWLGAISSYSLDGDVDPKENPGGADWYKVDNSVGLFGSIMDSIDNNLGYSKVKIVLEKDEEGNTRATIGYSTRDLDKYFANYIYGSYNSQYLNSSGNPLRQRYISEGVADAYQSITGNELPKGNYGYSYSWDERHRGSKVQGFIFFDESGNAYKRFLLYSGDNVTIQSYDIMGVPINDIMDVTEYLSVPELLAEGEKQLFFETLTKGIE